MKRAREEESTVEDFSDEEDLSGGEEPIQLAPREEVPPEKRQRVDEFDRKQEGRTRLIRELKVLRVNNPGLKIGLTAELDAELNALTTDQLEALRDNYHLELSNTKPFASGRAVTTLIGQMGGYALGCDDFCRRLNNDTELVANMDMALPFSFNEWGPALKAGVGILSHLANRIAEAHQWQPPAPAPPVTSNIPPVSSS